MKQSISFKSIALAALLALQFATPARAQVTEFGLFDHLSVGLTLGTTGTGVDVAAPIGNFLQVRAGYNFFSGFTYSEKIDYRAKGKKERGKTEAKAKNYMSTAHLLLDAYPFPKDFDPGEGIAIGDYIVEFDRDGYGHGAIKVNKFRPYLGIGYGRAVPRKRIGVSGDLGVMIWGKPRVFEKQTGTDQEAFRDDFGSDSDKYYDFIAKFPVWPVLTIRITGRIL